MIRVQELDFDIAKEYQTLLEKSGTGAVVIFVGLVREFNTPVNEPDANAAMHIQHYPGMTEKALTKIESEAQSRWPLISSTIIHRVGELKVNDQIVFVGTSSAHRTDAYTANQFIIDTLKTEAPFWKKEGDHWVESKASDTLAAEKWLSD
ncbi:MAG: molybdenum cofactor biosynthesis protein MoaE [Agarilytica sp.]